MISDAVTQFDGHAPRWPVMCLRAGGLWTLGGGAQCLTGEELEARSGGRGRPGRNSTQVVVGAARALPDVLGPGHTVQRLLSAVVLRVPQVRQAMDGL